MDSWINGTSQGLKGLKLLCFNPCFNGFMDKWGAYYHLTKS